MMQQTSIDAYFKLRKRPVSELAGPGKSITRKLFAQDDGPSSPVRSPVVTEREGSSEEAPQPVVERTHPDGAKETITTPTRSTAEQEKLQKELDLGEFKKLVRQSKKYTTLKAALEKHNSTTSHLEKIEQAKKDLTGSPNLKRLRNYEFEVETSPVKQGSLKPRRLFSGDGTSSPVKNQSYVSPRKLLDAGPVVSPTKPAFDRYKHLIADGKEALVLPLKYAILKEIFNGVETVVRIMTDRKEMITYKLIQKDVQKLTRRRFTEKHLAMIKAVYPDAYDLNYELVKLPSSREKSLELVIDRSKSHCTDICERKKNFEQKLIERTKIHHQKFLESLDPPLIVSLDKMNRWHVLFELNSVPDIEPASIPRPAVDTNAPVSVIDFLEETKQRVSCNKRMEHAVSLLIEKHTKNTLPESEQKTEVKNKVQPTPSCIDNPIPAFQKALKGVPKSVLEKIRAKKAAKMIETITQTPEEARKQVMLSRLPELAKIIRLVFVKEGKRVLTEDLVVSKVSYSFKEKMSTADLMDHLELLSVKCPGWMSFFTRNKVKYIRVEKDADMTRIVGKLQKLAQ